MKKGELEFKTSVTMLASSAIRIFDFNEDYIRRFLSKTRMNYIYSDIKSATKFLLRLTRKKILRVGCRFKYWSKKFNSWQKYLVKFVINNQKKEWYYLTIALHYILDSYYHIFKKFEIRSTYECNWCGCNINDAWSKVIANIALDAVPNSYVYTSLGVSNNKKKEDIIDNAFIEARMVYTGLVYDQLGR